MYIYRRLATPGFEEENLDRVPWRLLDVCLDAIDSFQRSVAIDRQPVWSVANKFARVPLI